MCLSRCESGKTAPDEHPPHKPRGWQVSVVDSKLTVLISMLPLSEEKHVSDISCADLIVDVYGISVCHLNCHH